MKTSEPKHKTTGNTGNVAGRHAPLKGMLKVGPKELRLRLGLTQVDFWPPVGVSQSGGSRYESGRNLPASTSTLIHLVHVEGLNVNQIRGDDCRVGRRLRETDPAAYAALLRESD